MFFLYLLQQLTVLCQVRIGKFHSFFAQANLRGFSRISFSKAIKLQKIFIKADPLNS